MKTVEATWTGEAAFRIDTRSGHSLVLDASPDFGGTEQGARPMEALLASLIACTAMDVISILRKMRMLPERFTVDAEGDRAKEPPRLYTHIRLGYHFTGDALVADRVLRAVELSFDQYCPVAGLLKKAVPISYTVDLNGAVIRQFSPVSTT